MNMITVHAGCFLLVSCWVYNQQPWATGHYNLFNIISINISAAVWRRQCRGVGGGPGHWTTSDPLHIHTTRTHTTSGISSLKDLMSLCISIFCDLIQDTLLQNGWRFELSITDKKEVAYIIVVIRCKEEKERRRGRGRGTATVEVCTQSQPNLSTSS